MANAFCHADRTQWRAAHIAVFFVLAMAFAASSFQQAGAAVQGPSGVQAMKKLAFMAGDWTCTVHGGPGEGSVDHLSYSFTPDWYWMVELSDLHFKGHEQNSSVQVWGWDSSRHKLVAHQFAERGIFTKTVGGWKNGDFVSRNDYNGVLVSIIPHDRSHFDWLIEAPDKSWNYVEACVR